ATSCRVRTHVLVFTRERSRRAPSDYVLTPQEFRLWSRTPRASSQMILLLTAGSPRRSRNSARVHRPPRLQRHGELPPTKPQTLATRMPKRATRQMSATDNWSGRHARPLPLSKHAGGLRD